MWNFIKATQNSTCSQLGCSVVRLFGCSWWMQRSVAPTSFFVQRKTSRGNLWTATSERSRWQKTSSTLETAERLGVNTALQKPDRARRRQRLASEGRTTLVLTPCARPGEGEARQRQKLLMREKTASSPKSVHKSRFIHSVGSLPLAK